MLRESRFRILLALVAAFCVDTLHAAVVQVSPGDGTLQAAIVAAADGDVLELQTGTYSGLLDFTKSVTVQPAMGASPVYEFSGHAFGDRLIAATGDGINAVWNDVPVVADTDFTWLILSGHPSLTNPSTLTFNNVAFTDTANNTGRGYVAYGWSHNTLNLNNCTFEVRAWRMFFTETATATINMNDCHVAVDDDGTNMVQTVFITHPGGQINVRRTVVDTLPQTQGAGTWLVYNESAGNSVSFINSVIWYRSATNTISYWTAGDLEFLHCTIVDRRAEGTAQGSHLFLANSTSNAGKLTLKNNLFDLTPGAGEPGTPTLSAVINDGGTASENQMIAFDIGENMLPPDLSSDAGANDPINFAGQVRAEAMLDLDLIHLTPDSPAINAASDVGISDDIDGATTDLARPWGAGFDFGADEAGIVPVELSTFQFD